MNIHKDTVYNIYIFIPISQLETAIYEDFKINCKVHSAQSTDIRGAYRVITLGTKQ